MGGGGPAAGDGLLWMIFKTFEGIENVGLHVHIMQTIGIVMIGRYLTIKVVFFVSYRRMKSAIVAGDSAAVGKQLAVIRRLVGANLVLGPITVASGGAYWR